jgi:hypothetical protein
MAEEVETEGGMNGIPPPRRPLVPMIIIGAIGLLLLSWAIFMGYYIAEERYKQRIQQPPPPAASVSTNVTE